MCSKHDLRTAGPMPLGMAVWKEPMVKIRRTQVLGVLLLASLCLLYLLLRYWQSR